MAELVSFAISCEGAAERQASRGARITNVDAAGKVNSNESKKFQRLSVLIELADVTVVLQRQVPTIQTVQKTMEIPDTQCLDGRSNGQVPTIQTAQKTTRDSVS